MKRETINTTIGLVLTATAVFSQTSQGSVEMHSQQGHHAIVWTVPSGKILLILPEDIRPGETIQGSVQRLPGNAVAAQFQLERYQFSMNGQMFSANAGGELVLPLPNQQSDLDFVMALAQPDGRPLLPVEVPMNQGPSNQPPQPSLLPEYAIGGLPIGFAASRNTQARFGQGPPVMPIAWSPRQAVFMDPQPLPGVRPFQTIGPEGPRQTTLRTLMLDRQTVSGLGGVHNDVRVRVQGPRGIDDFVISSEEVSPQGTWLIKRGGGPVIAAKEAMAQFSFACCAYDVQITGKRGWKTQTRVNEKGETTTTTEYIYTLDWACAQADHRVCEAEIAATVPDKDLGGKIKAAVVRDPAPAADCDGQRHTAEWKVAVTLTAPRGTASKDVGIEVGGAVRGGRKTGPRYEDKAPFGDRDANGNPPTKVPECCASGVAFSEGSRTVTVKEGKPRQITQKITYKVTWNCSKADKADCNVSYSAEAELDAAAGKAGAKVVSTKTAPPLVAPCDGKEHSADWWVEIVYTLPAEAPLGAGDIKIKLIPPGRDGNKIGDAFEDSTPADPDTAKDPKTVDKPKTVPGTGTGAEQMSRCCTESANVKAMKAVSSSSKVVGANTEMTIQFEVALDVTCAKAEYQAECLAGLTSVKTPASKFTEGGKAIAPTAENVEPDPFQSLPCDGRKSQVKTRFTYTATFATVKAIKGEVEFEMQPEMGGKEKSIASIKEFKAPKNPPVGTSTPTPVK